MYIYIFTYRSGVLWSPRLRPSKSRNTKSQQQMSRYPNTTRVLRVLGSLCLICHIYSGKTALIQFAPSKSLRLLDSSGPITDTKCRRLSPLAMYCTRSDIDHQLCYESGCCLHGSTKAPQCSQKLGGPTI